MKEMLTRKITSAIIPNGSVLLRNKLVEKVSFELGHEGCDNPSFSR
jgi:hypothetical protein